jgi:hypothetical protein
MYVVGDAWYACDDMGGVATGLSLWALLAEMIAWGWAAFYAGSLVAQRGSMLVRYAAGTMLCIAAVFALMTWNVPRSGPADYRSVDRAEYPECGPNGIPTWWPTWLPS